MPTQDLDGLPLIDNHPTPSRALFTLRTEHYYPAFIVGYVEFHTSWKVWNPYAVYGMGRLQTQIRYVTLIWP